MASYQNVAIVGVGLIGGSIGLALRQRGLAERVIGVGRRQLSLDQALACGAIHEATTNLEAGVASADVIVVATPVDLVAAHVTKALEFAPAGALVTDAGSTKASICAAIDSDAFVGSHPLAGDHRSGPEHAREDLLNGKVVVVTPQESSPEETTARAQAFWESLGARVLQMSPEQHDQALAVTSHLPHLVASGLAFNTPQEWLPLAATGWADTTRIAAAAPKLWTQIFLDNRPDVLIALDQYMQQLQLVRDGLANEDVDVLETFLEKAKWTRDALGN